MLNDGDDKFEGQEDSEYHFSDDDINYDVENEEEISPQASTIPTEPKENFISRLTRSKRMMISLLVFVVLIFVVYKMVTPTNVVPSTEISPPPAQVMQQSVPGRVIQPQVTTTTTAQVNQNLPSVTSQTITTTPQQLSAQTVTQTQQIAPPAQPQQIAQPQQLAPPQVTQPQAVTQQPAVPQPTMPQQIAQPLPQQIANAPVQQLTQPQQVYSNAYNQQPQQGNVTGANQTVPQQQVMMVPGQPSQTTITTSVPVQPAIQSIAPNQYPVPSNQALAETSNQLTTQLNSQYMQQVSQFANQSSRLQEQITDLSAKVSVLENQLSQLVQVLTKQIRPPVVRPAPPPQPTTVEPMRTSFTVQAIIPGRAWLKSDNGDTVTVAEGDLVKSLGRVSRIDPYDGVVEINTGTRLVSLSYGTTG